MPAGRPRRRGARADLQLFRALPASREQPFVFHVADDRVDPHFERSNGTQKDSRADVGAADFERMAGLQDRYRRKQYSMLSSPPQVGRGDAGRSPHRTAPHHGQRPGPRTHGR